MAKAATAIGLACLLAACGTVPPHYGQPTIRDADGRIIGYTTEGIGGTTEVRDRDGRLKYTVEPGYRSPHQPPGGD
ncbi:hypothetical protein M0534_01495 [Methylonatrum kenyense]|uniref:hypothetical protein n=1 Tax=Methylonatrum kenyense TaxID=455253 RepID=UPI0020C0A116|nr:hypothetical protein [Methylonatrum kenyense]MCK8515005.1 hypothetical protein [Methylonatrum kenyense]